jgi:hypothetical protein
MILAFALALLLQRPDTVPVFDSGATRTLVERVIGATAQPPADLLDYQASVQSAMYLTVAPDSSSGGDLTASVDELVSDVRWSRSGALRQEVTGHRIRMLVPVPYTLASILEQPWVIPHLYGSDIYTPFAGPRAVNPFGTRGPSYYRYTAEDTVRIQVQSETVTLVPVSVRPRADAAGTLLVVGTFYLDPSRSAVARARFGFVGKSSELSAALGRMETYLELDNALWEGRYWLPYQQRREVVFNSSLLGGAVAARIVNRFVDYRFNTGWTPTGPPVALVWHLQPEREAFAGWRTEVGEEAGRYSLSDFADLRVATSTAAGGGVGSGGPELQLHYERGSDLFRYDRVEGAYVGIGGRLVPRDPRAHRWQLYGTAGWAFAESTPRGELSASFGSAASGRPRGPTDWGATVGAYRRLNAILPFQPTFAWDWIYTLPALFWGSDTRDYYDATGVEAFATVQRGRLDGRFGARVEREDSVSVNTSHFLFGRATEFGPLAGVEPGTHVAIEAGGGYSLGAGAFGIGNSTVARIGTELGVGDFHFRRITALLSTRYRLGPLTLATRIDGGHAAGDVPPQKLFRFGSTEGLRGFEPNEFGGSTAVLARARLLVGLPPRSTQPLGRIGFLLIPPLRPSLVLVGESGWTRVDESLSDELLRLGARTTDGALTSLGAGISLLDDAVTVERLQPVGRHADERSPRWYVGLTYWY